MTIFDYFMALAIRTIHLDLFENIIFYYATPTKPSQQLWGRFRKASIDIWSAGLGLSVWVRTGRLQESVSRHANPQPPENRPRGKSPKIINHRVWEMSPFIHRAKSGG
ncbi:hypothetical protein APPUASWS_031105 [Arthrospira platensis str. Paraca]|nr:hypothetical protein APPUASWS_031105 [Arthrospira platensis str. Paraca]